MGRQDLILKLVDEVYDAALDSDRWPSVLREIANSVDGVCTDFYIQNADRVLYTSLGGLPDEALSEYLQHYHGKTKRSIIVPRSKEGSVLTDLDFTTREEMAKNDFYEDFLRKWDLGYFIGINALNTGSDLGFFGIHRPHGTDPPSQPEVSLLKPLVPHLKRAVQLHIKMASVDVREQQLTQCIEMLSLGVVLLDWRGRIAMMNSTAEHIIDAKKGLYVSNRHLHAMHSAEDRQLDRIVGTASGYGPSIASAGGAMLVHSPDRTQPLSLIVAPLSSTRRHWEALGSVVFISDPSGSDVPSLEETLRKLFQLTPSEARLAVALVKQVSLKEAAEHLEITEGSARQYLKRLFAKTNTHSQTELMKLLLMGPAALSGRST